MSADPAIDPIEAFLWLFSEDLNKIDPEGRVSKEIAKKLHLALTTREAGFLDQACREALKNYQRKLKTGL